MSTKKSLDDRGREILDQTPIAVPLGFHHPPTMEDRMKRFIRSEFSNYAQNQGMESFEEADDFDIPDDPVDPSTPWETTFDPGLGREVTRAEKNMLDKDRRAFDGYVTKENERKRAFDKFTKSKQKKVKPPTDPQLDGQE